MWREIQNDKKYVECIGFKDFAVNKEEMIKELKTWESLANRFEDQYGQLNKLFRLTHECSFLTLHFDIFREYTKKLSSEIGDNESWLQYYQFECEMGEYPREVIFKCGKKVIVKDLESLADVIIGS